jgi:hypothetical protein
MPYVVENSQLNWSDDEEPIPPKVERFVYMPANELGGPSGAARQRVPTGQEESHNEEFEDRKESRALHLALKASGHRQGLLPVRWWQRRAESAKCALLSSNQSWIFR